MRRIPALARLAAAALVLAACDDPAAPHGGGPDGGPNGGSPGGAGRDSGAPSGPADLALPPPPASSNAFGATVVAGGVEFRVWAPHATRVFVSGDFNGGSATHDELAMESAGVFAGVVPGARAGQSYAFVVTKPDGTTVTHPDPRARALTSARGSSVIVDPAFAWSAWQPPAPDDQILYELHLGAFNPPAAGQLGTWATAAAKLDYLAALGVNLLEIMPASQSPGDVTWGYGPSYPFAAHSAYGSPDDARRFVDAAHAHGIGVIIDTVHNHYSPRNGLSCFDGDCLGAQGAYFYTDSRITTPWGPRPDFATDQVRAYIRDNALMWLGEYGADGLRWDSTISIRRTGWTATDLDLPEGLSLLKEINDAAHALGAPKLEIAEDLQADASITRATSAGGAGFDAQWDAGFVNPVDAAIIAANDADRDMNTIRDAVQSQFNGAALQRIIYTDNHDQDANGRSRVPEMISPGNAGSLAARQRSTLGAAILLTTPGVPMLFMGQELLMGGHFDSTIPVDWTRATTYSGILALYTALIRLRHDTDHHTHGLRGNHVNVFHVNNDAKVIAYRRWDAGGPGDDVVVVANFGGKTFAQYDIGLPSTGVWKARFSSDSNAYSPDFANTPTPDVTALSQTRDQLPAKGTVQLGAYQVLVLSQ